MQEAMQAIVSLAMTSAYYSDKGYEMRRFRAMLNEMVLVKNVELGVITRLNQSASASAAGQDAPMQG